MKSPAHRAVHIASVVYDGARRLYEAVVEVFTPGLPQPLRVAVTVPGGARYCHLGLTRALVAEANRQMLRR